MLNQKCGRTEEQIEMLTIKLRIVDEELASGRWKTKQSKSHGRVVYLSLRDEKARYWNSFYSCSEFDLSALSPLFLVKVTGEPCMGLYAVWKLQGSRNALQVHSEFILLFLDIMNYLKWHMWMDMDLATLHNTKLMYGHTRMCACGVLCAPPLYLKRENHLILATADFQASSCCRSWLQQRV